LPEDLRSAELVDVAGDRALLFAEKEGLVALPLTAKKPG